MAENPNTTQTDIDTSAENHPTTRPELSAPPADRSLLWIAGGVTLVSLLLLIGFAVFLFFNPTVAIILRDIVIIFFGIGVVIAILLLVILIAITAYIGLKLNDLIKLLDREIKPILKNLQGALVDVRSTTSFISDKAVTPVIETVSIVSATRSILTTLFRRR